MLKKIPGFCENFGSQSFVLYKCLRNLWMIPNSELSSITKGSISSSSNSSGDFSKLPSSFSSKSFAGSSEGSEISDSISSLSFLGAGSSCFASNSSAIKC